jgi:hypothetical protein
MSNGMVHEEAREALEALALDALDASERAAVLAHLAGCESCRAELVVLRATAAELTYAVAPVPMSDVQRDHVRARLLARASTDPHHTPIDVPAIPEELPLAAPLVGPVHSPQRVLMPTHVPPTEHHGRHPTPSTGRVLVPSVVPHAAHPPRSLEARARWLAAAAIVVAVGAVSMLLQVTDERDTLRAELQMASNENRADGRVLDSLRAGVRDRQHLIENLTGPEVAVVTLAANGARAPSARMFWNQSANAWTFVAHNLSAPQAGRRYQLWLVTPSAKISAGTFVPNAMGDAVVRATYALPRDALAAVAVTDEPEAGSAQPTTVPVIVGSARGR